MVDLLVLADPHVSGARTGNLFPGDVVDPVGLLLGFLHLLVKPLSVKDNIRSLVAIEVKFLFDLCDFETTVVKPLPEISIYF